MQTFGRYRKVQRIFFQGPFFTSRASSMAALAISTAVCALLDLALEVPARQDFHLTKAS
jgi:hypothetical protein